MIHSTHRAHMGRIIEHRPRWESRPHRLHPGRREHIYGPIEPMETYEPWPLWLKLFLAPFVVGAVMIWMGG
jgi:hypothetical protein